MPTLARAAIVVPLLSLSCGLPHVGGVASPRFGSPEHLRASPR